jgi:hypothetical protein
MLDAEQNTSATTVVVSLRVSSELAQWITTCSAGQKRSRAAIVMLEALRETVPTPHLDYVVAHIRRPIRRRDDAQGAQKPLRKSS